MVVSQREQAEWLTLYCFYFYALLIEEAAFHWQFGREGPINNWLLERDMHYFIYCSIKNYAKITYSPCST